MDHKTPVTTFVGLDISLAETHICILDQDGTRLYQGAVASDPDALADTIGRKAPNCEYPSWSSRFIDPVAIGFDESVGHFDELAHERHDSNLGGLSRRA